MPICWLASAMRRSAAAISGRRSRSSEGSAPGITGGWRSSGAGGTVSSAGRLADEDGDGVFELGAGDGDVGVLDARGVELGLGLGYVGFRSYAALKAIEGELQGASV